MPYALLVLFQYGNSEPLRSSSESLVSIYLRRKWKIELLVGLSPQSCWNEWTYGLYIVHHLNSSFKFEWLYIVLLFFFSCSSCILQQGSMPCQILCSYKIFLTYVFIWEQVLQIVKKTKGLRKISFLAHSLGGLFARYAIAILYTTNDSSRDQSKDFAYRENGASKTEFSFRRGLIAGLNPINFITLATPHLGVRGKKQVCFNWYSLFLDWWIVI